MLVQPTGRLGDGSFEAREIALLNLLQAGNPVASALRQGRQDFFNLPVISMLEVFRIVRLEGNRLAQESNRVKSWLRLGNVAQTSGSESRLGNR